MAENASDSELLEAWGQGDRSAGARLFDRHFAPLSRFFGNKVEAVAADDLIQQTFLGCAEARERFRGASSFRTFLFAIARNVLHNHYRSKRTRKDEPDFSLTSVAELAPSATSVLFGRARRRSLLEALRRIPLEFQIVLELVYWERLKALEIAEIVAAPEGTVRSRLRRAKELVAKELVAIEHGNVPLDTTVHKLDDWAAEIRDEVFG